MLLNKQQQQNQTSIAKFPPITTKQNPLVETSKNKKEKKWI